MGNENGLVGLDDGVYISPLAHENDSFHQQFTPVLSISSPSLLPTNDCLGQL